MSAVQYFLLGIMVSWTPSLIVLAWLLRPTPNSEANSRKQLGYLDY